MAFPVGSKSSLVTVDFNKIVGSANLTDFRFPIKSADVSASVFSAMQGDGDDIRVTTDEAGTNEIPFEVVAIDKGAQTCEIWVKLTVSYTVDTLLYLWYGDASLSAYARSDTYGSDNVWTASEARYHLEGNSNDSAVGANDGTDSNVTYNTANGQLGQGAGFSTGYIEVPNGLNRANDTINSLGFSFKTDSTTQKMLYGEGSTANNNPLYNIDINVTTGKLRFSMRNLGGSNAETTSSVGSLNDDDWHRCVLTKNGSSFIMYVDGVQVATLSSSLLPETNRPGFGALLRATEAIHYPDEIDELEFVTTLLSADWVATEWNSLDSAQTFLTVEEAPAVQGNMLLLF